MEVWMVGRQECRHGLHGFLAQDGYDGQGSRGLEQRFQQSSQFGLVGNQGFPVESEGDIALIFQLQLVEQSGLLHLAEMVAQRVDEHIAHNEHFGGVCSFS